MPIKFSQFTNRTSNTAGTTIVGFDGNQNIKILSSDLVSGFINGTAHTLPVFATANTLGDSIISQDASATQLFVNGKVGIGRTLLPGGPNLEVYSTGNPFADIRSVQAGGSVSQGARIYLTAEDTVANKQGQVDINIHGPSHSTEAYSFEIANISNPTPTTGGDIFFSSRPAGSTIELVRFKEDGKVGIGTATPGVKLDVDGDVRVSLASKFTFANGQYLKDDGSAGLDIASISAAGTINFITNSADQMIITSAGDVGIGTTAPGGKLEVNGGTGVATSGGTLIVRQDGDTSNDGIALTSSNSISHRIYKNAGGTFLMGPSTDSDAFALDLNGNVGIGTTAPSQKLEVDGNVLLQNNDEIRFKDSGGTERTAIELDPSNNFNIGTSAGGNLRFINGSSYTERMRITSAGNVGIGTDSPGGLLHVSSGDSGDAVVIIEADADNTGTENDNPHLELRQDGATIKAKLGIEGSAGNTYSNSIANATYLGTVFEQPLQFITGDTGSVQTAKMTILPNTGNVGIGHTAPASRLHIKDNTTGTGNATGLTIEQDGTGDAIAHFLLTGARRWVLGVDNSDSDKFKLASSSDLDSDAAITVTTGGFVGIGTTNPTSRLQINDGSISTRLNYISGSDTYLAYVQADNGSVDSSIYIARSGSGGQQAAIEFEEDSTGTYRDNEMRFKLTQPNSYNVNEYMRFQYSTATTSLVNIQAYKPIVAMEGVYIGGSSNQNSAPHYLDDYEEGSFTPSYYGTSGLAITHDSQVGRYVKVGRVVHAFVELGSDAVTYASGNLEIHGLPFAADDVDGAATVGLNYSFGTSLSNYTFSINENNSKINIYQRNVTTQYPASGLGTGTNNNRLRLTMTYITTT